MITIKGETLVPRGDRTLWWPAEETLFVADVHLGKSAAFRALGVPVPAGSTAETLRRLSESVVGARRVVVLGDLWHARHGRSPENEAAWDDWLRGCEAEFWLVEGNHDLKSGDLRHPCLRIVAPGEPLGPFDLRHEPTAGAGYVLSGHLHPAVTFRGHRLPCFWFRREYAVLPPFGEFTGCAAVRPSSSDFVYAVAGDRVVRIQ
jgi:uncharacterized protein